MIKIKIRNIYCFWGEEHHSLLTSNDFFGTKKNYTFTAVHQNDVIKLDKIKAMSWNNHQQPSPSLRCYIKSTSDRWSSLSIYIYNKWCKLSHYVQSTSKSGLDDNLGRSLRLISDPSLGVLNSNEFHLNFTLFCYHLGNSFFWRGEKIY